METNKSGSPLKKNIFADPRLKSWTISILCLAAITFFGIKALSPKKGAPQMPPRPVGIVVAGQKDVPVYIEAFGTLVPPSDVSVKAQVTGEIKEVHFTNGQEVKKGEPLFTIDPSQYQAEVSKAEASVSQDAVNLKLAKDTLERNGQLVSSNLISKQDFERYQTDVSSAEARLRLDTASLEIAKINLGYCKIVSPIDGITGKCQVDPGNIITANSGPTLVSIKTIDTLYVDFSIPERELTAVRKAMADNKLTVDVTIEGDAGGPYGGIVIFIDNTVDNTTGTILLRASVANKSRSLWAGQFVNVRLILEIKGNAVIVPYAAIQLGQKGYYAFVVTPENKAELRIISAGNRQGEYLVIKDGIVSGEKVVVSGQMGLSPGAPVVDAALLEAKSSESEKKDRR